MTTWKEFEEQAPDLAASVGARFGASRHALLATLRVDGSPRLTGLETRFDGGELWLAMMPDSRKADDLRRDPRFALHSAPDVSMVDGDAKVNGRAIAVTDSGDLARFFAALPEPPPDSGVGLFRADLTEASLARVQGAWMVIDSWRTGRAPRRVRRQ